MRRFLIGCSLLFVGVTALGAADDTPKAASCRKKLSTKITVNFKDTLLRDVIDELKEQIDGLGIRADTKGGVNLNSKITYKADKKPATEVLDAICDKYDMGYFVVSQQNDAYDGSLKLTRGKERGTAIETKEKPKDK